MKYIKLLYNNNFNFSNELSELLSNDKDWKMRWHVLFKKGLSIDIIEKLSNDKDSLIRESLAIRKDIPDHIIKKIIQ